LRLWVDDVRPAPGDWLWVKSYDEAIAAMTCTVITEISLDHDLGMEVTGAGDAGILVGKENQTAKTGYDIACWIERSVMLGNMDAPVMRCHSANPVGRRRIEQVIEKLGAGK